MARDLELTLLLADYRRTRPLLSGEVTAAGIRLQPRRAETGEACLRACKTKSSRPTRPKKCSKPFEQKTSRWRTSLSKASSTAFAKRKIFVAF
jgi:hypothetical protein